MMKIKWSNLINPLIVTLLALVFFVATSSFNYLTQDKNYTKWTSPDETANYFFSKRLSETGQLAYFDSAAIIGDNLVCRAVYAATLAGLSRLVSWVLF